MSIIVFSANIGAYDKIKAFPHQDKDVRYILFTDNKHIKSPPWEIHSIDFLNPDLDVRRKARFIKVNSHLVLPKHSVSIWIDYCYVPKVNNFNLFLNQINFKDKLIMCYKHNLRNCIYEEGEIIKSYNLDYHTLVNKQMNFYKKIGFPQDFGLFDTGLTIRENCERVNKFNDYWWSEITNGSSRDQLSQVYAAWKSSIKIHPILLGRDIYYNDFLYPKIAHAKKLKYK